MRSYETMFIIKPTFDDSEIEGVMEKIVAFFDKHDVTIARTKHHGRKRLAYEILKHRRGFYVQLNYLAPAPFPALLTRFFKISDDIIRDMTMLDCSIQEEKTAVAPPETSEENTEKTSEKPAV